MEGASLMVPTNEADIVQVHGMFKKYPDLGPYLWVASDGQDHESAEEPALITREYLVCGSLVGEHFACKVASLGIHEEAAYNANLLSEKITVFPRILSHNPTF